MGGVTGMGWEVWEMLWGRTVSCYGVRMEMLRGWDGRCQLPALLPGCMVLQHGGEAELLTELLLLHKGLI